MKTGHSPLLILYLFYNQYKTICTTYIIHYSILVFVRDRVLFVWKETGVPRGNAPARLGNGMTISQADIRYRARVAPMRGKCNYNCYKKRLTSYLIFIKVTSLQVFSYSFRIVHSSSTRPILRLNVQISWHTFPLRHTLNVNCLSK